MPGRQAAKRILRARDDGIFGPALHAGALRVDGVIRLSCTGMTGDPQEFTMRRATLLRADGAIR